MVPIPAMSTTIAPMTFLEESPNEGRRVDIPAYFMDRFEVSNREFKLFVDTGGYSTPRYWKQPFVREGRELSWSEALKEFSDSTGHPGPSTWRNGSYKTGEDDYPVSGVSWYEAAAYAEYVGKRLPSYHHWMKVATSGKPYQVLVANFDGQPLRRVGEGECMTVWGTFDMAGNVKEWCWNEREPGRNYLLGGSSTEPAYVFDFPDAQSPWSRNPGHGFRCIKTIADAPLSPELDAPYRRSTRDFTRDRSISDDVFTAYLATYAYEQIPLEPKVEWEDDSAPQWTSERITINTVHGKERLPIDIVIPRGASKPYQAVVYFPGVGAFTGVGVASGDVRREIILNSRRVWVYPQYHGLYSRTGENGNRLIYDMNLYPGFVAACVKDFRRTIDYLETRSDINTKRVGFLGYSFGALLAPILLANEPRIHAAVLVSGGIRPSLAPPHVDQVSFAPRVRIPVLMLNGRYDSLFTEPAQQQLFRLFGTPAEHKRYIVVDAPHTIPTEYINRELPLWFDRYLGAPAHRR